MCTYSGFLHSLQTSCSVFEARSYIAQDGLQLATYSWFSSLKFPSSGAITIKPWFLFFSLLFLSLPSPSLPYSLLTSLSPSSLWFQIYFIATSLCEFLVTLRGRKVFSCKIPFKQSPAWFWVGSHKQITAHMLSVTEDPKLGRGGDNDSLHTLNKHQQTCSSVKMEKNTFFFSAKAWHPRVP